MGHRFQQLAMQYPDKYPENLGKPWSDEDTIEILLGVRDKKPHNEIAEKLKRTVGGIYARLRLLAWEYHCENKTIEQIQKNTGLTKDEIVDSISKYQAKQVLKDKKKEEKKEEKKKNTTKCFIQDKPSQTQRPVQIIESKSLNDVYSILEELRKDIQDIKIHLKMN
jgi:hypothetical protein